MADSEKHFAFHLLFRNPGYQRTVNSRHKKKFRFPNPRPFVVVEVETDSPQRKSFKTDPNI